MEFELNRSCILPLVTRDSLVQLGSDIKTMELPPVEVKGKTGKLEVFEIIYS